MWAVFVLIALIVVPLAIWQIRDPRGVWQATQAWKYRHPEANEPSDDAHSLAQVGSVFALVVLLVVGIVLASTQGGGDDDADDSAATPSSEPSPTTTIDRRTPYFTTREIGPGSILGYDHPSTLTIRLVVFGAPRLSIDGSCKTRVGVYEHTNAVIVSVTRVEESDGYGTFHNRDCTDPDDLYVAKHSLNEPLGQRPVLTAAPIAADPVRHGLSVITAPPEPLVEYPRPGVRPRLEPVSIDPAWTPVPMLSGVDEVSQR